MAGVFCYRSDIPATFALAVIRILQGRKPERYLEILRGYDATTGIAWVQAILDDNAQDSDIGWWKSKLLGN
jgi:hypothetical protein